MEEIDVLDMKVKLAQIDEMQAKAEHLRAQAQLWRAQAAETEARLKVTYKAVPHELSHD